MPTLTIRQIQAPSPKKAPRVLRLEDRAGPIDNIRWGTSQRHNARWYPGSGEAAVFLDGPEELTTELMFDWKTRLMGGMAFVDEAPLATADDLVEVIESFVRDQSLVEVTWRSRIQTGVLTEVVPVEGYEGEYTATLSIQWTKAPGFQPREVAQTPEPRSLYEQMKADWDAAIGDAVAPLTAARLAVEDAEAAIDDVTATFNRFGAIATEARAVGASAVQVYRGVGECLSSIVTQTDELLTAVAEPAAALAQSDDPFAQMRARAYAGKLATGAREARARAALERPYYRALESGDLLGTHVVVTGETVWSIAWKWYGDTSAWRLIANRNALAASSPAAGTRLYIPRRAGA